MEWQYLPPDVELIAPRCYDAIAKGDIKEALELFYKMHKRLLYTLPEQQMRLRK